MINFLEIYYRGIFLSILLWKYINRYTIQSGPDGPDGFKVPVKLSIFKILGKNKL